MTKSSDPPVEPHKDTYRWIESPPNVIGEDVELELALVMVRVGCDMVCSLISFSALAQEAANLARENMAVLRNLSQKAGLSEEDANRVSQLCAGRHPAAMYLTRARNKIGFHWDGDFLLEALKEFRKNDRSFGSS